MIRPLLFAPVLGLLLLAPRADELTWKIAAGTTLVRSFERDSQLALESVSVKVDGQDQEIGEVPESTMSQHFRLEISDLVEKVDDASATKLVRTFSTISAERSQATTPPGGEAREQKLEMESALEGKSVVFEDGEDGWSKSWAKDQEGDDALLLGLRAELDFQAFLPGKSVSADDSWELEPEAFLNFLRPGGRLTLTSEEEPGEQGNEREKLLDESLEGKGKATFKGVREEDGVQLAVIAIECELRMHTSEDSDAAGGKGGSLTTQFDLAYDLEGEILWDLAAGVARSASLSGELEVIQSQEGSIETDAGEHKLEQVLSLSGKTNYKASIEPKS